MRAEQEEGRLYLVHVVPLKGNLGRLMSQKCLV